MISKNILMDLVSNQATASAKTRKYGNEADASYPRFDSFLTDNISKKTAKEDFAVTSEKSDKSYRQIPKSNNLNVRRNDTSSSSSVKKDDEKVNQDEKEISNKKEKAVIKGVAELLGISTDELRSMLENCQITPAELVNPITSVSAVSKLSDMLGLDSEQQKGLSTAVMEISNLVTSYLGQVSFAAGSRDMKDWVKVEGLNVEVVDNGTSDLSKSDENLSIKIQELVNSLQQNTDLSLESSALKIREMIEHSNLQKQIAQTLEGKEDQTDKDVTEEDLSNSQDSTVDGLGNTAAIAKTSELVNKNILSSANQNDESLMINAVGSSDVHKGTDIFKSVISQSDVKTVRNEIMNQIVEKAKVLLDGQKSEMLMELKPESLGKLALKVVTENGIVMAKFVAENQQVKEVLESNMQVLKDSLEKQGLAIQGFSVSVGQDSERGSNMQRDFYNSGRKASDKVNGEAGIVAGTLLFEEKQAVNPYATSESSVDFKA